MTTVYLIRHAEAEGNVYRRCHGQYDSLLTARGREQLNHLAKRFTDVPLDAVYASDLYRARHTAKAIADCKGMMVRVCKALREIDMGQWEDKTWAILPREYPEVYAQWQTRPWVCQVPGGETVLHTGERVLTAVRQLAQMWEDKTIAIVTHGTAIRGLLCNVLGYQPEQIGEVGWGDNTCVAKLEIDHGQIHPIYWNDASHLPEALSTFAKIGWTNSRGIPTSVQIWYRPYQPDVVEDQALLLKFAQELNQTYHGGISDFDEWIAQVKHMIQRCPWAVTIGMVDDRPVALIRLDVCDHSIPDAGVIDSVGIDPDYRGTGLSGQVIGQVISVYRAMNKDYLCAYPLEKDAHTCAFYRKYGFEQIGLLEKSEGTHLVMRKRIRVDSVQDEAQYFICEQ